MSTLILGKDLKRGQVIMFPHFNATIQTPCRLIGDPEKPTSVNGVAHYRYRNNHMTCEIRPDQNYTLVEELESEEIEPVTGPLTTTTQVDTDGDGSPDTVVTTTPMTAAEKLAAAKAAK